MQDQPGRYQIPRAHGNNKAGWIASTVAEPETRTAQGLTGCAEKKLVEFEKSA
jgi:hypothetical protein